jgi:hypothetical protein
MRPRYYGLDLEGYRSFIAALPEALPNLKFVYLCPQGDIYYNHFVFAVQQLDTAETLLVPIDFMMRKLPRLVDCRVALPKTFVKMLAWKARGGGPLPEGFMWDSFYPPVFHCANPLWRDLRAVDESADIIAAEPAIKGYWICPGSNDEPRITAPCF